jgi:hypothetical protein
VFDEGELLEEARRRTGLRDLGGTGFLAGLRALLPALRDEAGLHEAGAAAVREDLLRLLGNRLRMTAVFAAHPEIGARRVVRPLVVAGLPRTGSSILHELLAQDPENRAPLTWEVKYPRPRSARASRATRASPRSTRSSRRWTSGSPSSRRCTARRPGCPRSA